MKIESKENIKNGLKTIVIFNKKKFIRTQRFMVPPLGIEMIEWRRAKTNQLVKKDQASELESKFEIINEIKISETKTDKKNFNYVASGTTMFMGFEEAKEVKKPLSERIRDAVYEIEKTRIKAVQNIRYDYRNKPNQDNLKKLNTFFKNNAERKKFIITAARIMREYGSLTTVKFIKDITGWGLKDSKEFMDEYVYVEKNDSVTFKEG